jgi:glucokinase
MPEKRGGHVLAGDIGGTKTNLGIFSKGASRPLLKILKTYPSGKFHDFESIVMRFLKESPAIVEYACFGIAGPVHKGRCNVTNLPWEVSEHRLKKRFGLERVKLINDLTATAIAIPSLKKNELYILNRGRIQRDGNIALIAPGTGLGESIIVCEGGKYIPVPSEGGHVDFAPNNRIEAALWGYLKKKFEHVSLERILTGQGLADIHSFIMNSNPSGRYTKLIKRMKETDPAMIISEEALNGSAKSCRIALDMFVSILGAAAGNLALTAMSTGGVYLGGGIPPRILPKLKGEAFLSSFTGKGRFKGLLEKMPVYAILNDKAALLGAALKAFELVDVVHPEYKSGAHSI